MEEETKTLLVCGCEDLHMPFVPPIVHVFISALSLIITF